MLNDRVSLANFVKFCLWHLAKFLSDNDDEEGRGWSRGYIENRVKGDTERILNQMRKFRAAM